MRQCYWYVDHSTLIQPRPYRGPWPIEYLLYFRQSRSPRSQLGSHNSCSRQPIMQSSLVPMSKSFSACALSLEFLPRVLPLLLSSYADIAWLRGFTSCEERRPQANVWNYHPNLMQDITSLQGFNVASFADLGVNALCPLPTASETSMFKASSSSWLRAMRGPGFSAQRALA